MLLPSEVSGLIAWFAAFQSRIGELVADVMQSAGVADPVLERGEGEAVEWAGWLDDSAHPQLNGMRDAVEQANREDAPERGLTWFFEAVAVVRPVLEHRAEGQPT